MASSAPDAWARDRRIQHHQCQTRMLARIKSTNFAINSIHLHCRVARTLTREVVRWTSLCLASRDCPACRPAMPPTAAHALSLRCSMLAGSQAGSQQGQGDGARVGEGGSRAARSQGQRRRRPGLSSAVGRVAATRSRILASTGSSEAEQQQRRGASGARTLATKWQAVAGTKTARDC